MVANSLKNSIATTGAATSVTANDLNKLPVNGRNFTSLMDLSPLSTGSSLSGQLASSTNYTIDGMSQEEAAKAAVEAVKALSVKVGIPQHLSELGIKEEDLPRLAASAIADVCLSLIHI